MAAYLDGSFVVSGVIWSKRGRTRTAKAFLQRFLADGTLDSAFGKGGTLYPGISTAPTVMPWAVVAEPDGSVVVAGRSLGDDREGFVPFLVRYLPNGMQDPLFGSRAMLDLAGTAFETVTRTPEGRYLVGGARGKRGDNYAQPLAPFVARFLPTGTLDPTFGTGGSVTVPGLDASVFDVNALTDGRVVGVGLRESRGRVDPLLWRLTALGAHDATFGRNGVATVGHPTRDDAYYAMVVGAGNTVTAVGYAAHARGDQYDSVVARFLG